MTKKEEHASVDERAYRIGDVLPGDWMIGGVSQLEGKPIAFKLVSSDFQRKYKWKESARKAEELGGRLGNIGELSTIFRHAECRDAVRSIVEHAERRDGLPLIWSSTPNLHKGSGIYVYDLNDKDGRWGTIDERLYQEYMLVVRDQPDITLEP